jgi:hypothetical protein
MLDYDDKMRARRIPPRMTLDQLLAYLQAIREEHGGDALVVMCDDEPAAPPIFEMRESHLENGRPGFFVILSDRSPTETES